jgi:hypothetical protein
MMSPDDRGVGPPKEVSPVCDRATPTTTPTEVDTGKLTAATRQCHADTVAGLYRRRKASQRMVPLDCGCPDPWPCNCTQPPLSDRWVDAGRDAARHLLEVGHVPLLKLEVLRALYRRGGDDRALAEMLHVATGGEIR